jgi:hypothetical protein
VYPKHKYKLTSDNDMGHFFGGPISSSLNNLCIDPHEYWLVSGHYSHILCTWSTHIMSTQKKGKRSYLKLLKCDSYEK